MALASEYSHRMNQLTSLFEDFHGPTFAIRCPRWSWYSSRSVDAVFTLVVKNPETFEKLMRPSETALGEAFISGELDVGGDLFSVFEMVEWLLNRDSGFGSRVLAELHHECFRMLRFLMSGPKHSRRRDADSISHHYDCPWSSMSPGSVQRSSTPLHIFAVLWSGWTLRKPINLT